MKRGGVIAAAVLAAVWQAGPIVAQEIVHALSGKVTRIDPASKTLQFATNDGSSGSFSYSPSGQSMEFNPEVKSAAAPVATLKAGSDQVILLYMGDAAVRTAVGAQDLGPGPFDTVEGVIEKFDRHKRTLTVQTASGQQSTFVFSPKALADTPNGAVPITRFDPSKGDNVRVIASKGGKQEMGLFVRD